MRFPWRAVALCEGGSWDGPLKQAIFQSECGSLQCDCDDDLNCWRIPDKGDREAGENRQQSAY